MGCVFFLFVASCSNEAGGRRERKIGSDRFHFLLKNNGDLEELLAILTNI